MNTHCDDLSSPTDRVALARPSSFAGLRNWEVLIFCILVGTLMPLIMGYSYGTGDQLEQLPLLSRAIDPNFCANDFFLNASQQFNPRTYYSWFLAILAQHGSVPKIFLALTWASGVMLALVTYGAAKSLVERSDLVGMFAVALVVATPGLTLGRPNFLIGGGGDYELVPAAIASWIALAALWAGLRDQPVICGLLAAVACIVQPLIGAEVGAIALTTAALLKLFDVPRHSIIAWLRGFSGIIVGFGILGASYLIFWHGRTTTIMGAREFIDLIGNFRSPHQYIPSTFRRIAYVTGFFLLLSFLISWCRWCRETGERKSAVALLIPAGIVLLSWIGGYLFVEIFPSRLWATAQTFRLGGLVTWLGFLVVARSAAKLFALNEGSGSASGAMLLAGTGDVQGVVLLLGHLPVMLRRVKSRIPESMRSSGWVLPCILGAAVLLIVGGQRNQSEGVLAVVALSLWYLMNRPGWWRNLVPLVLISGIFFLCLVKGRQIIPFFGEQVYALQNNYSPLDDIAIQARKLTPAGAVFLTPSDFARFRLLAQRAIVVDFKCTPVTDQGLREWKQRLDDCYGPIQSHGFEAIDEMDSHYQQTSWPQLQRLAQRYGATHAILFTSTPSEAPVLAQNALYKMVSLGTQKAVPAANQ
jgi:hypothetical protein